MLHRLLVVLAFTIATALPAVAAPFPVQQPSLHSYAESAIAPGVLCGNNDPVCEARNKRRQAFRNGQRIDGSTPPVTPIDLFAHIVFLVATFYLAAYILGRGVREWGWQVGATRKALGAVVCLAPFLCVGLLPAHILVPVGVFALCFATFCSPLRSRSDFLQTCFASIDRPEDRPHTLPWLLTSLGATVAVFMASVAILQSINAHFVSYLFIPMIVSCIGDALAEPVGLAYGRHTYETRALWGGTRHTRSLEGSACVFLSAVATVLLLPLPPLERALALAIFPPLMTAAEAYAPHTWDQPFIYLAGLSGTCVLAGVLSVIA